MLSFVDNMRMESVEFSLVCGVVPFVFVFALVCLCVSLCVRVPKPADCMKRCISFILQRHALKA